MNYQDFEQLIQNKSLIFYPGSGTDFETLLKLHYNLMEWDPDTNSRFDPKQFVLQSDKNPNGKIPLMVDCSEERVYKNLLNFVQGKKFSEVNWYFSIGQFNNEDFEEFYNRGELKLSDNLIAKFVKTEEVIISKNEFDDEIIKLDEWPDGVINFSSDERSWIKNGLKGQVVYWEVTNHLDNSKELIPFYFLLNWDLVILLRLAKLNIEISGIVFQGYLGFGSSGILSLEREEYFNLFVFPINIPGWIYNRNNGNPLEWPCYTFPTNKEMDEIESNGFIQTPSTLLKEELEQQTEKWERQKVKWEQNRETYRQEKQAEEYRKQFYLGQSQISWDEDYNKPSESRWGACGWSVQPHSFDEERQEWIPTGRWEEDRWIEIDEKQENLNSQEVFDIYNLAKSDPPGENPGEPSDNESKDFNLDDFDL